MNPAWKDTLRNVKPISPSLIKLLGITADSEHSLKDVIEVIRLDSVLTAYLLRAANSAAFRRSEQIDSLDMAVSLLGERFVVGLALDLRSDGFFAQPLPGYESAAGDLWRHCIKTALAARLVCQYARKPLDGGQVFTAGILHDIGKVVLSSMLQGQASDMVAYVDASQDHASYLDAEREKLGFDHCEAGLALAELWRLPVCYREAIAWHHHPGRASEAYVGLVYAVHLGDAVAMMSGAGTGADCLMYAIDADVGSHFKLDDSSIPRVLLGMEDEYEKITASMSEK
jgi:HD-like signal output (HDOD) protein